MNFDWSTIFYRIFPFFFLINYRQSKSLVKMRIYISTLALNFIIFQKLDHLNFIKKTLVKNKKIQININMLLIIKDIGNFYKYSKL